MDKGTAAIFTAPGHPFELRQYPLTSPARGSALIEMLASGVCGTDVHIFNGKLDLPAPLIIGHEMVGRIAALNENDQTDLNIGDIVIVNVAAPCGECMLCKSGDSANCLSMGVTYCKNPEEPPHLHGGYASHCYSPLINLIPVPPSLPPVAVSVFACTGSTVLHAMRLSREAGLGRVKTAVVQGTGPMGMFAIMYLHTIGVENVIAVTYQCTSEQESLIKSFGAQKVLQLALAHDEATAQVISLSGGIGADFVIECSGNPAAFPQGMEMLRNRGVYAVPGQYSNAQKVPVPAQMITFKALRIIGSSQYDNTDVYAYLDFLLAHPDLYTVIGSLATTYPLSQVNQAISDAKACKNIKTMLVNA